MQKVDIAVTIAPKEATITDLFKDLEFFQDSIDIIELRIDQWADITGVNQVVDELNELPFEFKVLITYRSNSQGGKGYVNEVEYQSVIQNLIDESNYDMLDIEWDDQKDKNTYLTLINKAHQKGIQVVLSHHNFNETPSLEELKFTYYKMHQFEADYLKVAVMPNDEKDVLHLLEAVKDSADALNQHIVGIAMSDIGLVSRTAQGVFGGTVSYGCLNEPHAPGQIHVEELKKQIDFYNK
ncbi:type I 3-dehydroquinate dehydratase [Staphylococcus warneri]|uniref:3-dehydroquinate dehydratase n=1 Tax=Staphylococcus warneri TaxID=1292 RepID=A0A6H3FI33_STAWA|nr:MULTISPECIES: type I 3-dehydroquinate dehydratase [Staphylococcus]MBJ7884114.1 type I 3-dehydroquinate dehydratase [Bacillaceae bacterium HSR45]MCC8990925.1 type I 3-dehydroquinate dehydratase [Staphylococcus sp.]PAK73417.1 3-dehydroquinase [Staphylococcus pasteuri]SKR87448.1 3-dehydroquinate dehydratase [Mycobacteroides abscessus subsp. abscessus]AGC91161.1 3-dehydroquinate dehydratase [Staphylococcus warneri SG1]